MQKTPEFDAKYDPVVTESKAQYTNKTVMRTGGLIFNSTKFFPLFESADVLALPNSSH